MKPVHNALYIAVYKYIYLLFICITTRKLATVRKIVHVYK